MIHSIRTGTGRSVLKGAVAAALMAGTALVAPNTTIAATLATASNADGTVNTIGTGQATSNAAYIAPIIGANSTAAAGTAITVTLGAGKRVVGSITGLANAGNVNLVAYYYDSSDAFIEAVNVAQDSTADADTVLASLNSLPTNATYKYVRFGLHFVAAGDGVGTANAVVGLQAVQTNASPGTDINQRLVLRSKNVTTASGDTAISTAFKNDSNITRYDIGTYNGPVISDAKQGAANTGAVTLTMNVGVAALANNVQRDNPTPGVIAALKTSDGTNETTFNETVTAGSRTITLDGATGAGPTAFGSNVNKVKVLSSTQTVLTDLAGNSAAFPSTVDITKYSPPAYASAGESTIITAASAATARTLWTAAGHAAGAGETLTITTRFAEPMDATTLNLADDITVAPTAALTGAPTGAAASGNNLSYTLALTNTDKYRFDRSTGRLQHQASGSTTWTDVTILYKVGASALATAAPGSQSLATALAAKNIVAGIVPSLANTNISTRDGVNNSTAAAGADGKLDGATIDYGAPMDTFGTGIQLASRAGTNPTLTSTGAVDTSDNTKVNVTLSTPATADWDGNGTGNETADNTIYNTAANFNTDAVGATVRYQVRHDTAGTQRYLYAFGTSDGLKLPLQTLALTDVGVDGAGPILTGAVKQTNATDPTQGQITLTFSENITKAGNQNPSFISTNSGTLALDLLNGGATVPTDIGDNAAGTATQLVLKPIPNAVLDNITSIGIAAANATGTAATIQDTAATPIKAPVATVTPTNTPLAVGPYPVGAAAVVDVNQNITSILTFLSKDATATVASGASLGQRFNVDLVAGGSCNAVADIPVASAAVSGSVVTLTLQSPGISRRTVEGCTMNVDYVNDANTYLADASGNRMSPTGSTPTTGADVSDTDVTKPTYSANTWTQEIRGQITTDGTVTVPQGTLVRADLLRYRNVREIGSVLITLPTGERDVMVDPTGLTAANFDEEDTINSTTFDADITVTRAASQPGTISATIAHASNLGASTGNAGAGQTKYRVQVNRTSGAITGVVTGTVNLRSALTSLQSREAARYAIADAQGRYRVNVGANFTGGNPFVQLSVKRPGQDWVLVTQADPSFSNHIPFAQDIALASGSGPNMVNVAFNTATGQNGSTTLNVDLSKIRTQPFAAATAAPQYQLVGLPGQWSRNSTRLADFRAHRFLTTIDKTTGAPVALWTGDANFDEAFILSGNTARSAFELQRTNVDTMGTAFTAGLGLAWNDNNNGRSVNERNLYYPISATSVLPASLAQGWHLITYNGTSNLTNIGNLGGSTVATQRADMVIEVGGGNQARTWLRSQTADDGQRNTLTSLVPGQAYFVYLSAAVPAFTFQ